MSASKWEERYRKGELLDRPGSPLLEEVWRLWPAPPGRALDLACGPGRHAIEFARRGWQVTAIDAAPTAIRRLKERASALGLRVDARVADLEATPELIEPQSFDVIADFCYLQRDLFPRLRAALRPGGLLVAELLLVDPRPETPPMNPAFLLDPGELPALAAPLEILHYAEGPSRERGSLSRHRLVARLIARQGPEMR